MGLYLCIFDDDEDIDGVDVGTYENFNSFRDYIIEELEAGKTGDRFPTLMRHSDSDGEWSSNECEQLRGELAKIYEELNARPPIEFIAEWQVTVAKSIGLNPANALESFIDVDGEFLVERLQSLVDHALRRGLPILFQ